MLQRFVAVLLLNTCRDGSCHYSVHWLFEHDTIVSFISYGSRTLTDTFGIVYQQILEQILGDALYYPPTTDALVEFPSPESLKRKIIISTKPPKEYLEACSTQKLAMENRNLVEELEKEDKLEQTTFAPLEENHILGENTPSLRKEVEVLSQKVGHFSGSMHNTITSNRFSLVIMLKFHSTPAGHHHICSVFQAI